MAEPSRLLWVIPDRLAKAPRPNPDDLAAWKQAGITSVVNLLEEWHAAVVQAEKKQGFNVLFAPMPDFGSCSIVQLHRAVQWIDAEVEAGKKVVVHCYAGIGRTGTVLAAYLMYKGKSVEDALTDVGRVFAGPQSDAQFDLISEYDAYLKEKK